MGEPAIFIQPYVPPALQILLITGLTLCLVGFESVAVYYISNWQRLKQHRKVSFTRKSASVGRAGTCLAACHVYETLHRFLFAGYV